MLKLSIIVSFKITKVHTLNVNIHMPLKLSNYLISVMLLTKVLSKWEELGNFLKRSPMLIRPETIRTIVISSQERKIIGNTDHNGLIR
jgi:hypothetical protein